jgi:N-acetylglutamate synthase-like GNAT family acetyltransferase
MHEWAHLGSNLTMIRPAQPHDAAAVHALVHEAYQRWILRLGRVPGPMKDDYAQRIAAHQVWVLEVAGEVVGVVVLEEQPEHLLLENVAVLPREQGKGYGRLLIAFAEQEAVRRGLTEVQLCTNARLVENIALYESLGFTEFERYHGKGFVRICLAKQVPDEGSESPSPPNA